MTQIPGMAPRVLIVDDDDGIRMLMRALLLRQQVDVDCVSDGEEALCKLRKKAYDAIVLDLMLPRTNGFEVLRYIKNTFPELLPRTIVVTAVSNSTLKDFDDGRLVRRILRKPFDIEEFIQEVFACSAVTSVHADAS